MDPIVTPALIAAGASVLGQGANALAQGSMNKKTREWNTEQYKIQKDDNVAFWNMQNSYNSPQAQMARLQEAGLNPNLVYGNGATAMSSKAPDTPTAMPYKPQAPQVDLPNVVDNYFNVQTKQQMLDNLKKQGDNLAIEGALKASQAQGQGLQNDWLSNSMGERLNALTAGRQLTGERVIQQALANMFNSGYKSTNLQDLAVGEGNYSQQLKSLALSNQLRQAELKSKKQDFSMQGIRKSLLEKDLNMYGFGKGADIGVNLLRLIFKK